MRRTATIQRSQSLKEAFINDWICGRCKQAMVTVAWLSPAPTGSAHKSVSDSRAVCHPIHTHSRAH